MSDKLYGLRYAPRAIRLKIALRVGALDWPYPQMLDRNAIRRRTTA